MQPQPLASAACERRQSHVQLLARVQIKTPCPPAAACVQVSLSREQPFPRSHCRIFRFPRFAVIEQARLSQGQPFAFFSNAKSQGAVPWQPPRKCRCPTCTRSLLPTAKLQGARLLLPPYRSYRPKDIHSFSPTLGLQDGRHVQPRRMSPRHPLNLKDSRDPGTT
ncbi:unnamed protein product [Ectocarpus sp. 8 AP-2014]